MISVEENEVGKSADIKYIELSNLWVNEIIATITNITEQIKMRISRNRIEFNQWSSVYNNSSDTTSRNKK